MKYFVFSIMLLFLFTPFYSLNAQVNLESGDINIELFPSNPGPNTEVEVILTSYVADLNSSKITWKVDGAQKISATGEKNFFFTTGDYGKTTRLEIIIETRRGDVVQKALNIKPADVDIIWESEGYIPPFYKGKSIFSYENRLTFIAIPHITNSNGVEISPKNLIYKWKNDSFVIENASGYGKNTYSIIGSIVARTIDVDVEVTDLNGETKAIGSISVPSKDPEVLFYKKSPLYGIEFQKALVGEIKLTDKEIAVVATPYFFGSTNSYSQDFIYKWSINGQKINNNPLVTTQIFRQQEGVAGTSNISVSIENINKVLQLAKNSFQITFGDSGADTSGL